MNSSGSSQPLRDPLQITFVISKNLFTPTPILPILNGQYPAAWNANHNFWKGTSVKSYNTQIPDFLVLVLHQFLYQQISFSQLFKISLNIVRKKFCPKFSFFLTDSSPPSNQLYLLNGQNLLNVTKAFCQFSLKCLLKYF